MAKQVIYEKKGHIAYITLNRMEQMNAINSAVRRALTEAWVDFRDDPEIWIAILTGAGDKAFCAGGDLKELYRGYKQPDWVSPVRGAPELQTAVMRHLNLWKPVIAAINGHCLAGGLALALACDIRLASPNATFGCSEVRWSHMAGGGQSARLARMIPFGWAMELILSGQSIDAATALRVGLVNRVVPQPDLLTECTKLSETINANGPLVAQHSKEFIYQSLDMPLSQALFFEGMYYERLRRTKDYDEGTAAFVNKKKPGYSGKQ